MAQQFDNERWEQSRRDHLDRAEIDAARREVLAGHMERVAKPGAWRVCKDEAGAVVVEVF